MSAIDDSFWNAHNAYRNRDNYMEVFLSTLNTISNEVSFVSAKSCLTLGPGEGLFEIRFIEKCAGNITKLTAVEQDHESANRLKTHLKNSLPNVAGVLVETDFLGWKGPDEPVDLVLLFHVLYYWRPDERHQFLRNLHDFWLAAGGFVVVVSASRTKSPGNGNEIFRRLGTPLMTWENIEADLLEVGFIKQHVYEMQFTRDFSSPDESFLRFYQSHVNPPVTLDDIRDTINELYPEGKCDQCFNTLAVFERKH